MDFYADDKSVGALSGYTPNIQFPDTYHYDVFSSYRSCSCCWATWRDRWQKIDWNLEHFSDFVLNKEAVNLLKLLGEEVENVESFVGAEQEYFLVLEEYFEKRLGVKFYTYW